jgi:hypothetical protein|tara:strand:- start:292 stop:954 length:663 start_codon:yes stop_codon:yes gene_type:complete
MSAVTNSTVSTTENQYERFRMQKDLGVELIKNIKKVLRNKDINFTEDLSNSFELVMMTSATESNVGTTSVATSNPYANLVDKGMRAGKWVNYDALYDWVSTKLWSRTGLDEKYFADVTWKIMRKIKNEGIDPTHFAKKAIKMVIGKHGVAGTKRNYKSKSKNKSGKYMKKLKKFAKNAKKAIKKMKRVIKKIVKIRKINKGLKQINKYGVRTLNTLEKYK